MKIDKFEIENLKRVKVVKIKPNKSGLTVIGGKNAQGKTSVLDSIAWALGGNRYKPSQATREGSVTPPHLRIVMDNGLVVERKGKNSTLSVVDPSGEKRGQSLLDSFVEELALNLPKFMQMNAKEKGKELLQIIGLGEEVEKLEKEELEIYNKRHQIGQIADQKKKFAKEQEYFPDVPDEIISAAELISEQQEILAKNGENKELRDKHKEIKDKFDELNEEIAKLTTELKEVTEKLEISSKTVEQLQDESTAELEKSISDIDEINRKVRINLDKAKAEEDARDYSEQYEALSHSLEATRQKKADLLKSADLPLEELSVAEGELIYKGQKWDNMSASEQLKVSTAIVRRLKPDCQFILLDKLEQMDLDTLNEFGEWLENENLQAIATRVSTGDECQIIIEDGYVKEEEPKKWKEGEF